MLSKVSRLLTKVVPEQASVMLLQLQTETTQQTLCSAESCISEVNNLSSEESHEPVRHQK